MWLTDVLAGTRAILTPDQAAKGFGHTEISDVTCDSRQVTKDALFIAVDGHAADGHNFIAQAFDKGAAAVLARKLPQGITPAQKQKVILSGDTRKDTAVTAANFFGHPSRDLMLIGVTGTNGKTSITWLLEQIFTFCGITCGVIGTVNIRYPGTTLDNPITTPDAVCLQKTMHDMKQAGVTHVIMEVSSHSLDQHRVDECEFNTAVFTNLTQDHLDYHQDLEAYFACKMTLFTRHLASSDDQPAKKAVVNIDNEFGKRLCDSLDIPAIRVSAGQPAEIAALDIKDDIHGLRAVLDFGKEQVAMTSVLTGRFNLENILCAAGAALSTGISPSDIVKGIAALERVPGRLEKLATPLNRHIFVDYAHTPDALESILETLSSRAPARVITVFGCGGDRDKTKRGPMGIIACKYSDIAIVTSDNPRSENPDAIVDDIIAGIRAQAFKPLDPAAIKPGDKGYIRMTDRAKALSLAVKISKPRDIIVAAGKGHETYQITNQGTIHFDDKEHLALACDKLSTPLPWQTSDLSKALETNPVNASGRKISLESLSEASGKTTMFAGISTDSRTISSNQVFVALEGERFDGHNFISDLAEKGIKAFVVKKGFLAGLDADRKTGINKEGICFFETPDTLFALGALARYHRMRTRVHVAAITGSNGKTTTRQMAENIFSRRFDTLATRGNLNNEIGLPLTLLRLAPVHEWAVVEMGMNRPKEIARLTAIACPDIAIVTNTLGSHIEGLGSLSNVARAKAEIFQGLKPGGTAIIFRDDPRCAILEEAARKSADTAKIAFFGADKNSDVALSDIVPTDQGLEFCLTMDGKTATYGLPSPAAFMAYNAAAAASLARAAGINGSSIAQGLLDFTPVKGRMNLKHLANGIHLIDDTYNANPASMAQALTVLHHLAGPGCGIAILGDMLELGQEEARFHRETGHLVAELSPARLLLFGTRVAHLRQGAVEKGYPDALITMGTKEELSLAIAGMAEKENWILLKGSRGMAMETLIPTIEQIPVKKAD